MSATAPGRTGRSSRPSITVNRAISFHHHSGSMSKNEGVPLSKGDPLSSALSALRISVPTARPRALDALSVRPFRIYAAAQVLVSSGTWIQNITQDWLVLTLTRDAGAVGLTAAFQFLPALLLGPLGGRPAAPPPGRRPRPPNR